MTKVFWSPTLCPMYWGYVLPPSVSFGHLHATLLLRQTHMLCLFTDFKAMFGPILNSPLFNLSEGFSPAESICNFSQTNP